VLKIITIIRFTQVLRIWRSTAIFRHTFTDDDEFTYLFLVLLGPAHMHALVCVSPAARRNYNYYLLIGATTRVYPGRDALFGNETRKYAKTITAAAAAAAPILHNRKAHDNLTRTIWPPERILQLCI
jgi:hypothetical protein